MPVVELMSWDKTQPRWRKLYKGRKYFVTCRQLGLPVHQWTKAESVHAANQWWRTVQTELDAAQLAAHPHAPVLATRQKQLDHAKRHGLADEADVIDAEIVRVRDTPCDEQPAELDAATVQRIELAGLVGVQIPPDADPLMLNAVFGDSAVWQDRFKREKDVPTDKTIRALTERWLTDRQHEARAGVRSSESADALKRCLYKFRDFVGMSSPAESLTADLWQRWYVHCAGMVAKRDADDKAGWAADTAQKIFTISRSFVRWLWEADILPSLPRNLTDRKHRFERPDKTIPTFADAEVGTLVGAARGVHRLILLLMLNCGMTQKDVADLRKSQVDLDAGRITRRRSKMAKRKASREVSYKLWSEVVALLREHLDTNPDEPRALVTKSGKPWVWTETMDTGKMRKSDNVATIFNNLKRRVKMVGAMKSVKVFRKASATRLKSNKDYRDLRFLFLGHSERTVADRHYAGESQALLDEAITWLGTQYGIN